MLILELLGYSIFDARLKLKEFGSVSSLSSLLRQSSLTEEAYKISEGLQGRTVAAQ